LTRSFPCPSSRRSSPSRTPIHSGLSSASSCVVFFRACSELCHPFPILGGALTSQPGYFPPDHKWKDLSHISVFFFFLLHAALAVYCPLDLFFCWVVAVQDFSSSRQPTNVHEDFVLSDLRFRIARPAPSSCTLTPDAKSHQGVSLAGFERIVLWHAHRFTKYPSFLTRSNIQLVCSSAGTIPTPPLSHLDHCDIALPPRLYLLGGRYTFSAALLSVGAELIPGTWAPRLLVPSQHFPLDADETVPRSQFILLL